MVDAKGCSIPRETEKERANESGPRDCYKTREDIQTVWRVLAQMQELDLGVL